MVAVTEKKPIWRLSFSLEDISLADVEIDPRYQREPNEAMVEHIASNFNRLLCGPLSVGKRDDGTYWLIDGQTRREALLRTEHEVWPCIVMPTTAQQEASLFVSLNQYRRQVKALEKFKARVFSNDEIAGEINDIAEKYGFKIAAPNQSADTTRIVCVARLESLHKMGILDQTLQVLGRCWGGQEGVTDDYTIGGVGRFLRHALKDKYDSKRFSWKRLYEVFEKYSLREVRQQAELMRTSGHGQWSRAVAVSDAITVFYNKSLPNSRRLRLSFETGASR